MSRRKFQENCAGCRPVLLDPVTMQKYPDDHPVMKVVLVEFDQLNRLEKEAWHRVTCLNSRLPADMRMFQSFMEKIQAAVKASS